MAEEPKGCGRVTGSVLGEPPAPEPAAPAAQTRKRRR